MTTKNFLSIFQKNTFPVFSLCIDFFTLRDSNVGKSQNKKPNLRRNKKHELISLTN